MQAENAQEWAMREKLSSEKLALERENKRMRNEIIRLEDELRERSRPPASAVNIDVKTVQDELALKTKVAYSSYILLVYSLIRIVMPCLLMDILVYVFESCCGVVD